MLHIFTKVGKVLDLFSVKQPEWGISEVAHVLEMPKSSVCEIMSSLASQGLLFRTSAGRYRLGWRLIEMGQTLQDSTDFYLDAHGEMQKLVEYWGEAVHLSVLEGQQIVHVEKMHEPPNIQVLVSHMNTRLPAYCSSVGKVLLAYQEWYEVRRLYKEQELRAFTPKTITTLEGLAYELEQVRTRGYAYDKEEVLPGLCCVSAPIHNLYGKAVAGISLVITANRFYQQQDNYTTTVLNTAQRISEKIGYRVKKQRISKARVAGSM